jgi:nucleoside-diphosphate-sugar epimerase
MKALITGGTGFIGSNVVDLLVENGHSVRLFSRNPDLPARLAGKEVSLFPGDLRDPNAVLDAMTGMDAVYHVGELRNVSPRAAEKNVELVERMSAHVAKAGIKRLVFISSLTVAGVPASIPATEDTKPRLELRDHYTTYKKRCEELLRANTSSSVPVIIRPGVVYGPGSRHLGSMIRTIELFGPVGFPFAGRGGNAAPLIQVKDLARAVYLAGIEQGAGGQVFNLTDGQRHSWADFFHAIAASLGKKLRILAVPPLFLRAPARVFDVFSGIIGLSLSLDAYVSYAASDLLFENGKARRLLNWEPEYTLAQGVEEMVREYRAG